jgi:hypothetical protein
MEIDYAATCCAADTSMSPGFLASASASSVIFSDNRKLTGHPAKKVRFWGTVEISTSTFLNEAGWWFTNVLHLGEGWDHVSGYPSDPALPWVIRRHQGRGFPGSSGGYEFFGTPVYSGSGTDLATYTYEFTLEPDEETGDVHLSLGIPSCEGVLRGLPYEIAELFCRYMDIGVFTNFYFEPVYDLADPHPVPLFETYEAGQYIGLPFSDAGGQFRFKYDDPKVKPDDDPPDVAYLLFSLYGLEVKVDLVTNTYEITGNVMWQDGVVVYRPDAPPARGTWLGKADTWMVLHWTWVDGQGSVHLSFGDLNNPDEILLASHMGDRDWRTYDYQETGRTPEYDVHMQRSAKAKKCWNLDATDLILDGIGIPSWMAGGVP